VKHTRGDTILWWCPNSCGYTTHLDQAGRYEKAEADRITKGSADTVVAVPCPTVEALAHRAVSSEHLTALQRAGHACLYRGCPETTEGDVCAKCIAGDDGPTHHAHAEYDRTWCDRVLMEGGARTWREHEKLAWDLAETTCAECLTKATTYNEERKRLHYFTCHDPHCEGCKVDE